MENSSVHYRSSKKQDRFLPCLMARLTDNEPQDRIDHVPQLYTVEQLKKSIQKNLEMILNSSSRLSADEKDCGEIVRDSVLFLGLPNFSGRPSSKNVIDELRQEIIHQIRCFEPRIKAETLDVELEGNPESGDEYTLRISGTVIADPVNELIIFEQKVVLDAGALSILPEAQNGGNHG